MILLDVNLLIYAHNEGDERNARASAWLTEQLSRPARVGVPWHTILGFLRLSTNPRVFPKPRPTEEAWSVLERLFEHKNLWIPQPTDRHAEVLRELMLSAGIHGNLVSDAHLAALAIEHGLTLCSTDGDFARFKGLHWLNPLAPSA